MNSWGAQVTKLEKLADVIPISSHQVTTENVDSFHWRTDVTMYL